MTESEWLSSDDPSAMLNYLTYAGTGVPPLAYAQRRLASDRKLRLWCAAVNVAHPLPVIAPEWFHGNRHPGESAGMALSADVAASMASRVKGDPPQARKAALFRCLFGNPYRLLKIPRSIAGLCCSGWESILSWNDRTVSRIAQSIYDDDAFDRLPILADALEEAGCTDADLLMHCRALQLCPGCSLPDSPWKTGWCRECDTSTTKLVLIPDREIRHVRGCWALDLILGKE